MRVWITKKVINMEDDKQELVQQLWYYQDKVDELEEQLDELKLENENLRYELSELNEKKGDK